MDILKAEDVIALGSVNAALYRVELITKDLCDIDWSQTDAKKETQELIAELNLADFGALQDVILEMMNRERKSKQILVKQVGLAL